MKMPNTIPDYFYAPCGMNCMVCYAHLKKKKPCNGCRGDDKFKPGGCRACKIKECVASKGHTFCFQCEHFPCKLIKNLEKSYKIRYHVSLIENSVNAKTHGIEFVLNKDKEKWKCDQCGGVVSLHDRTCSDCNVKKLMLSPKEEK